MDPAIHDGSSSDTLRLLWTPPPSRLYNIHTEDKKKTKKKNIIVFYRRPNNAHIIVHNNIMYKRTKCLNVYYILCERECVCVCVSGRRYDIIALRCAYTRYICIIICFCVTLLVMCVRVYDICIRITHLRTYKYLWPVRILLCIL